MANTQGSSSENPLYIEDDWAQWTSTRLHQPSTNKTTTYIELDSDGECTELPTQFIPVQRGARIGNQNSSPNRDHARRKRNDADYNQRIETPANQEGFTETDVLRSPSTKPDTQATISLSSDNNQPLANNSGVFPRTESSLTNCDTRVPMPLMGNQSPSVVNNLMEKTMSFHPPSATYLPPPQVVSRSEGLQSSALLTGTVIEKSTQSAESDVSRDGAVQNMQKAIESQQSSVRRSQTPKHCYEERRKVNVVQFNGGAQESSRSPIGGEAEPERERATSRGWMKNATLDSDPVDKAPDDAVLTFQTKRPRVSDSFSALKKPRMVKRAMSPPQWKSPDKQSVHRTDRDHAHSPVDHVRRSDRGSRSVTPSEGSIAPFAGSSNSGQQVEETECSNIVNKLPLRAMPEDKHAVMANPKPTSMGPPPIPATVTLPVLDSSPVRGAGLQPTQLPIPRIQVASPIEPHAKSGTPNVSGALVDTSGMLGERHADDQVFPENVQDNLRVDLKAARLKIDASLKRHLKVRYEDHAYLTKNAMWRQRTCYERENRARARGPRGWTTPVLPEKYVQAISPFHNMSTVQTPFDRSKSKDWLRNFNQETFTRAPSKKGMSNSAWSVSTNRYKPGELQMPPFREHIGVRTNILADNESRLLTLPWFGDIDNDKEEEDLIMKLQQIYELVHGVNGLKDLRNEQCRFYTNTVDKFLLAAGITWETILYWLLAPEGKLQRVYQTSNVNQDMKTLLIDRSSIDTESVRTSNEEPALLLERAADYRQKLFRRLEEPSASQLVLAALACATILAKCKFSPWYMARKSKTMQDYVQRKTRGVEITPKFNFRRIVCRVCHEHNCLFHGQVRETPDSDSESDSGDSTEKGSVLNEDTSKFDAPDSIIPAHVDSDDSDVEKVINYRIPMNSEVLVNDDDLDIDIDSRIVPPFKPFDPRDYTESVKWENRRPFIPCNHAGNCAEVRCRCFRQGVTCEKTCKCPSSCNRRFPGCKCASEPGKRACTNRNCLCAKFQRECDADLCVACGATEILDPVNRYNEDLLEDRCRNVGIQRGVPKKTLLGQSEVHGFGLYAGQDIKKDDIVGEYTGEVLSTEESQRREHIYGYEKNMYLFKLNMEQDVDATRIGNKLRFINNANPDRSNCHPKVLFCNTVFRVALYASVDIKAGTELFFWYNYPAEMTKHFKQPKAKVVAVKQTISQPAKPKLKRVTSPIPSRKFPAPASASGANEMTWHAASLAKARAAKAAKRAAMLAEKEALLTSSNSGIGSKQVPKSVPDSRSERLTSRNAAQRSRPRSVRDLSLEESIDSESAMEDDDQSNAGGSSRGRLKSKFSRVIQETDDEGDGGARSNNEGDNVASDTTDRTEGVTTRGRGRSRTRMVKSAQVLAVREIRKTKDTRRQDDSRKRKRPVIINSDDE